MITYKKSTIDDLDVLIQIRLEMLKIVNSLPEDYVFSPVLISETKKYYTQGNQTTVLAFDGEKAIGCATLSYIYIMPTFSHPTGNRSHLMNVYTNSNYRRQGIGAVMVKMLIDEAREKGVTEISLDATQMGQPLYKALGFTENDSAMVLEMKK